MTANQRYVINGDWAIDWPGTYEAGGTQVRYTRTADAHESLEAAGPTQEDLLVMVRWARELFGGFPPGCKRY